jgi:hypothetical protein
MAETISGLELDIGNDLLMRSNSSTGAADTGPVIAMAESISKAGSGACHRAMTSLSISRRDISSSR